MSSKRISNINDYTLIEKGEKINIYFYPQFAFLNQKITEKKDQLCITFELKPDKKNEFYTTYIYITSSDNNKLFSSYSMYAKKIEKYKYAILKNKKELENNFIIDFNTLDYKSFLEILSQSTELYKMIPHLKRGLNEVVLNLENKKEQVRLIDIPSPLNYYQNVVGYLIDELEHQLTTEEELGLSKTILKNLKKSKEVVLKDKNQLKLSYLGLYSIICKKVRSDILKPENILEAKDLKSDTNKTSISKKELNEILKKINNKSNHITEDINIVEERITYILNSKPRLKELTKFVKIILIDDKYLDTNRRNRSIEENKLKNLIIESFINGTYRILSRNQMLFYNLIEDKVDFIAIISLDRIYDLLNTFKFNALTDNLELISLAKTIDNLIAKDQHKKTENTLKISVLVLLLMINYYYKNINENMILFSKANYVFDFSDTNEIIILNKETNKKIGKISRLTESTIEELKNSYLKNETTFIKQSHRIINENLIKTLDNLNINIIIDNISHQEVKIKINKSTKNNCLDLSLNIGELLIIISSLKQKKELLIKSDIQDSSSSSAVNPQNQLKKEEYDYIIRKSKAIVDIMNSKKIDNSNYKKIVKLYNSLEKTPPEEQEEIILKLKDLI